MSAYDDDVKMEGAGGPKPKPKSRRGSASMIASRVMSAVSKGRSGKGVSSSSRHRGKGEDLLVAFPGGGDDSEEEEEYVKPVTRRPGQSLHEIRAPSSSSNHSNVSAHTTPDIRSQKTGSRHRKAPVPSGGRRSSFDYLKDLIFGGAGSPTSGGAPSNPEPLTAPPPVFRPGQTAAPATFKPGQNPVPQPAVPYGQEAEEGDERFAYNPTVDAMSKGGEAARLQARQVEQAKMGTPAHRPLVGGFAAAAYEAAREYHYVHAKEEERKEIIRPKDRPPPPSI
jgi:hypothetical protein|eukprot:CAMPEP_0198298172 /NCGR_PEP_ID=MMETSP1449-20131203/39919_1 /TAXON_ID=420275 /ORGANISM="Attheya septentrionalis, Strain CCMP2084" /LENGTH=280 /DNA_ID=CAMNT_0043999367 /DNA_START=127 /DNA_END=969 /DNA_ORIENTATION=-